MAKKKTEVTEAEQVQEAAVVPEDTAQELTVQEASETVVPEPPTPPWVPEDPAESEDPAVPPEEAPQAVQNGEEFVRYRVRHPGGVHLRVGPGRAYRSAEVLTCGTEILGEDVSALLREDREPGASAWLWTPCAEGVGWVDGAYLERVDDAAE